MSYIGSPPKQSFTSGLLDRFTSTTGTTVTLTHDIASENDIVVFVNFVKQDSTTYSVGGTGNKTLTLGGTLVSSDIVEVHYLNIVGQTVNPSANSVGSSQLTSDVITGQTALAVAPDSTDELLISDAGVLKRVDVSLIGGANTPAFRAFLNSNKTMSDATTTKVDTFGTEDFDTDNNFASSRFTPTTAGKYFVFLQLAITNTTDADVMYYAETYIYKNGSQLVKNTLDPKNSNPSNQAILYNATIVDMNGSSDYLEAYANSGVASGAPLVGNGTNQSYFGAYKLIGV